MQRNKILANDLKKYWTLILDREDFEPNQTVIQTIVSKINFIFALQLAKECKNPKWINITLIIFSCRKRAFRFLQKLLFEK